jgi:Spy/CpxP family protein refolding chaperone
MTFARRALMVLCLSMAIMSAPAGATGQEQTAEPKPKPQGQQGGGGQERRTLWWRDPAVHKELDLSARQITKLEKIATAAWPSLRELHKQMETLEDETSRLIRENTADEKVLAARLDRLEAVRSRINKERTLMVYRMHQTLTPEQYRKLTEINQRRRKESGRR